MKIETGKVYVTLSGSRIKVLCVDATGAQPIVGVDLDTGDADKFNADGGYYEDGDESGLDLVSEYVEPPKPKELWVRKFENGDFGDCTWEDPSEANEYEGSKLVLFREVIE